MAVTWNLRKRCAERNIWSSTELWKLLKNKAHLEITLAPVNVLMRKQPSSLNMKTLSALCYVLECKPNDLIEFDFSDIINYKEALETQETAVNENNIDHNKSYKSKNKSTTKIPLPPL